MGLDIIAYSHLRPVGLHTEPGEWCRLEDESGDRMHIHAFAYHAFPRSFRGIEVLRVDKYSGDFSHLEGGCYEETDDTETHEFRAGSYGGYNEWRDLLRKTFNPDTEPDKPFYELIWFADNEGTIGPEACKDLLADFREHADAWKDRFAATTGNVTNLRRWEDGTWELEKYEDWTRAFELGAENGLVEFH